MALYNLSIPSVFLFKNAHEINQQHKNQDIHLIDLFKLIVACTS